MLSIGGGYCPVMATTAGRLALQFLTGALPVSRDRLADRAGGRGPDANVPAAIEQLPDRTYESPADVRDALGRAG